uniref:Uncharacterized protein n=1 Tax=viral metagenome TaxID=1070528 RepID=A0A6C0JQ48_9ZZZZ
MLIYLNNFSNTSGEREFIMNKKIKIFLVSYRL